MQTTFNVYFFAMEKQKVKKAVLTDAGYATRFLPITKTLPKSMIPILDKPITHYIVEECMIAGITEIIIVATEEGKSIYEDYFHNTVQHIYQQLQKQGKEERFRKVSQVFSLPNIIVITQDKNLPYGNGSPAIVALPYISGEPFIYAYTDDMVFGNSSVKELIDVYNNSGEDVRAVIAVKDIPDIDVTKYGITKIKEDTENELDYIIEKPTPEEAPSRLVSFGRYLFTPDIFNYLSPSKDNLGKDDELWTVDAIHRMAKKQKVLVKPISGAWKTTGDPVNYLQTSIDFALDNPEYNGKFKEYLKSKING
ncbi:hypothetical protein CO058_00260 [candidate division WWE3 bacterium CG_4_9_14_0_2_um_filter_35_11]|uniref:UTP--glucose-1-phosphate uridylyltransferase n=1 Tax=candidate division WWE3 bacterium CG_4_9_14_0_2_um_filter_35_11 TaxID=1975077 RepID=A0A2M8EMT9_UNCKA|nr:MAG: hypothetical protein COV25_00220 [candidate division WWE3 bacterium CG10_big_fil_rev_8_21_14_0_10_35_32]PJC24048.1 MAG: hypothetical protein CO058_00260 [candidate division WWE3 bacterium CG_4_9_14_0_2_um_filter_35_11]